MIDNMINAILLKCEEIDSIIENESEQSYAMYLIAQKVYEIREFVREEREKNDRKERRGIGHTEAVG